MGLFDIFKKKNEKKYSPDFVRVKYFDGSREKFLEDVKHLIEVTKFDVSDMEMAKMLVLSIMYREMRIVWNKEVVDSLQEACGNKLQKIELKWLFCYCDAHYVNKSNRMELLLLLEQAGRQIGMPAPTGEISPTYKFK